VDFAKPTHVGLNLIFLVPGETGGMEVAARELIPALVAQAPAQTRFTAFINRETAAAGAGPWGDLVTAVTVPVNARNRVQWVLGEQTLLPRLARAAGADLVHSLASTAPLWGPFRRVVTIHDLIYARFPEAHTGIRDRGMKLLVPAAARHSDRVIVDSHSTRELGERHVLLSLSAKRPHKNLLALIGALARIPAHGRPLLVLPGYPTAHEHELRERALSLGVMEDLRFPAWVSPEELEGLWAVAEAFVFPSLYEGFGLPVLEAMARGVPVACSDSSSLPEVAGEAALLFDPRSEEAIAQALERLLGDERLRERLRALGLARAGQFTWERTARLTLETYARALA
jgi:glycosyltransferase involved in cell wall biosynthesis